MALMPLPVPRTGWPHVSLPVKPFGSLGAKTLHSCRTLVLQAIAVLGVDFMSENVRAILDEAGHADVHVYRMAPADIGCSLAEAAEAPAYSAYLGAGWTSPLVPWACVLPDTLQVDMVVRRFEAGGLRFPQCCMNLCQACFCTALHALGRQGNHSTARFPCRLCSLVWDISPLRAAYTAQVAAKQILMGHHASGPCVRSTADAAASGAPALHVVYINTSLRTKALAHAAVPTITCTSSNVVQTVLQVLLRGCCLSDIATGNTWGCSCLST